MEWTLKSQTEKLGTYVNEEGIEKITELIYEDRKAKWWTGISVFNEHCLDIYYQEPVSDEEFLELKKEKIIDKSCPQYESLYEYVNPRNEEAVFFLRYSQAWLFNDCALIKYRVTAKVLHKRKEGEMF